MGVQKGIIRVAAKNGNWWSGPTLGPNDMLTLSLVSQQAKWSVIAGNWSPPWGDLGYPGGGQYAAPGLPQAALIIRDGNGHKQSWPQPPEGFVYINKIPGLVLFIANDEQPHDNYNGYLDNEGDMQLFYQWAGDNVPNGDGINYWDPTPNS